MIPPSSDYQSDIENARQAFRRRDRPAARYWAQRAAGLQPDQEEPWLWLAAVASPHASLDYLKRALEINPDSRRARQGMHWAIGRLRAASPPPQPKRRLVSAPIPTTNFIITRPRYSPLPMTALLILIAILGALFLWSGRTGGNHAQGFALFGNAPRSAAQVALIKATRTPTPTFTSTPTSTPTNTPIPTDTPTPIPTDTPLPTDTPYPTEIPPPDESYPPELPDLGLGERWIDVDLTQQMTYAYEGDTLVNSFIVSTGTWQYPTVSGQYYIYVKYEAAPMSGPGYYLPGVPYIMYFYQGYGLHGTYWHNNFGTPMSHGCVNLRTEDAEWLFYWASIGTLVNVHY
jgi:lipoprotein-anchoring transpeptidase ErfK/SrfK